MATEKLAEELIQLWRILRSLAHPVKRAEITPEQYWLLRLLNRAGSLSVSALANQLGIAVSSATSACKRLEKAGLLTRERQADDERMVHVTLTEQGHAQIDRWQHQKIDALTGLLSVLDEHDQLELQRIVERVLNATGAQTEERKSVNDSDH